MLTLSSRIKTSKEGKEAVVAEVVEGTSQQEVFPLGVHSCLGWVRLSGCQRDDRSPILATSLHPRLVTLLEEPCPRRQWCQG